MRQGSGQRSNEVAKEKQKNSGAKEQCHVKDWSAAASRK
jgi:hypothetical protein